jgi:hypothetical protein
MSQPGQQTNEQNQSGDTANDEANHSKFIFH